MIYHNIQNMNNDLCVNYNIDILGGIDNKVEKMSWINSQEYTVEEANNFIYLIKQDVYNFSPLTTKKFNQLRTKLDHKWSNEQIIATWHFLSAQIALRSYRKLDRIPNNILFGLNSSDLLQISNRYKVPPLALVKKSLEIKGYPKFTIDRYINEPNMIEDSNIYNLVLKGWENDPENPTTFKIIFDKARDYEIEVEEALKETGVFFKTQEDLTKEQIEIYGRAVLTPDFYFPDPVTIIVSHPDGSITDHKINWIDVKNFMFLGASFITKSIKEQAEKYVKEFGSGALLFHYGFVNSVEIPDTIMLSGSDSSGFSPIYKS